MSIDYYINISVLPDPEFEETVLMNALFAKLHRALWDIIKSGSDGQDTQSFRENLEGNALGNIAVSFPLFKKTLGKTLRLHGSQQDLQALMNKNWQKGLSDYTDISEWMGNIQLMV